MIPKNNFSKIKEASLKLAKFLDKKGFYIVIFLCVLVVGATIAVVSARDYQKLKVSYESENELQNDSYSKNISTKGKENAENKKANELIKIDSVFAQLKEIQDVNKKNIATKNDSKIPLQKNVVKKNEEKVNKEVLNKKADDKKFIIDWPVFGKIVKKYSNEKLIYSETLDQWTTHQGVDISCDVGSAVRTIEEGVVRSIKQDPLYGITILIEHDGDFSSQYSNLSTASMVKSGQIIKRGKVISGIGKTAGAEWCEKAHLHFELRKNGKLIDPSEYLPKM